MLSSSCPSPPPRVGDDNAHIKLADFGFAKNVADISDHEKPLGTPAYVSPEVLAGRGRYGTSCDIWSCGVVSYILLCGCPPFQEEKQEDLFEQIMAGHVDFHETQWSHVSTIAMEFVSHMLVVDPADRWTASKLLQHPWIQSIQWNEDCRCEENLEECLAELRRYNARKKLKRVLNAVVAVQRFKTSASNVSQSDDRLAASS